MYVFCVFFVNDTANSAIYTSGPARSLPRSLPTYSCYGSGRGELQRALLIETRRREGFELAVSRPRVVMHKDEICNLMEPIEEVVVDVDEEHSGIVVQKMSERKAEMTEMRPSGGNRDRKSGV